MPTSPDDAHGPPRPVPTLRTARLVLRPIRATDGDALHAALSDPGTMTYWSSGPHETVAQSRAYVLRNVEASEAGEAQCFAITRTGAVDDALGWVILMDRRPGIAELGYVLRPDATGVGSAREAVRAVVEHGFTTRDLRRIWADTDPDNEPSKRLLEALGFRLEGHLRARWETHLGVRDSLIYGLLASDPRP